MSSKSTHIHTDLQRLRAEYAERECRFAGSDIYSRHNPSNLFILNSRERACLRAIRWQGAEPLCDKHILEMGCGGGKVLLECLQWGAEPEQIYGVDLLKDRILDARLLLPHSHFFNADCQNLPFRDMLFDLVLQFTAFSSVLNGQVKRNMASEMLRVLKPDGLILWYDFWTNPFNKQTKGIRKPEIRRLFPDCRYAFRRITLAPPLARRIVPVSWLFAMFLEKLWIFNTHYLVGIRKTEGEDQKAA
jgi:SAM-dependent methyltransferase